MNTTTSRPLRRVLAGALIAAGASLSFVGLAATANALPESTIEANCKGAGSVYGTVVRADGVRVSTCCPTGAPGEISQGRCSIYVDGVLSARLEETPTKPPRVPINKLPGGVLAPAVLAPA